MKLSEQIRLKRPKPNSFEIPGRFHVPISSNSDKAAVSHNIIQADTNFWVEVGSESLVMVSGVAIHDIEHLDLIEVMLGSVCGEDAGYTWVEDVVETNIRSKTEHQSALNHVRTNHTT